MRIVGKGSELPPHLSEAMIEGLGGRPEQARFLREQARLMQSLDDKPLVAGNKVTLLVDGEQTYASMFEAIGGARDHINFQTFIFEDDAVGRQFADLLARKSAEGVQVNLIYDSFGSLGTPGGFFQRLREAGVSVLEFNPVNPVKGLLGKGWSLSHRGHRKLVVVDGRVAFVGGVNISGVYSGSSKIVSGGSGPAAPWRDTQVRIEGPAVAQVQELFLETWRLQHGPPLPGRDYYPKVEEAGPTLVRVVGSLPGERNRRIFLMYMSAIEQAERSIHLTSPYFVPDGQMLRALAQAARRGVDVKIILPSLSDSRLAFYAGRRDYEDLLEAGVQLYERRGRMLHAKTAVVDGVWSTVGSNNLDTLSLLTNDEANVVILGHGLAQALEGLFDSDLRQSERIDLGTWERRSVGERLKEWLSSLLRHWL